MNEKKNYKSNGYFTYPNLLSKKDKIEIEKQLFAFSNLFRKKIVVTGKKLISKIKSINDLSKFCIQLDKYNKDLLFNFNNFIGFLPCFKKISSNENLINIASKILDVKKEELLIQEPSCLINLPQNKRVLYSWHNAKNYYPKRNKYLNLWMPVIVDKKSNNGTMEVALGSHLKEYPFLEFKGFSKDGKNALNQNFVPDYYHKNFKKKKMNLKYGDFLAMHPNLLHSSCYNSSKFCSYVIVWKVWHIGKDWTLSSNISQKYFSGDTTALQDIKIL